MGDSEPGGAPAPTSDAAVEALLQQTRRRLASTRKTIESERESVEDQLARKRAEDRSEIARIIVYLFAGSFVLTLVAIPVLAWTVSDWTDVSEKLLTLLSSVLLPVVTLVIGYYFGSEQQKRD